uniref:Uncharacterized protein n=1 Tax=Candidatus Kentrum sp. MB TaxID=2138164 RepID=A0A450XTZ8_9GAMM|nr:MAG: hypothetical protein BECKMB1821G_GA0114241_11246 [Candidatus Kentron sp. MB]VFK34593.1 MAG: hypothetical protein BECKMB1821I_GA0114274_10776 [Candidatus Kentron sp. MB]VFK76867.1 MAG: hypothetical protein BECKMB1821H_GA0114242_107918 [Candidatus Kentron sp. MB]
MAMNQWNTVGWRGGERIFGCVLCGRKRITPHFMRIRLIVVSAEEKKVSVADLFIKKSIELALVLVKRGEDKRKMMDDIVFRISESKVLTPKQRQFLKLQLSDEEYKSFWDVVMHSKTKDELIRRYKEERGT